MRAYAWARFCRWSPSVGSSATAAFARARPSRAISYGKVMRCHKFRKSMQLQPGRCARACFVKRKQVISTHRVAQSCCFLDEHTRQVACSHCMRCHQLPLNCCTRIICQTQGRRASVLSRLLSSTFESRRVCWKSRNALRNCSCVSDIDSSMDPAAGDIDDITRHLHAF